MQRLAGILALLAGFVLTDHIVADHPSQLARRLGFRWSAGYHWRTPGYDSSYYNPWGGYHGCHSCGNQTSYPDFNRPINQNSPGANYGLQKSSGKFSYPTANSQPSPQTFQHSLGSYQRSRNFGARPLSNRLPQFNAAPAAYQKGFGFPSNRR